MADYSRSTTPRRVALTLNALLAALAVGNTIAQVPSSAAAVAPAASAASSPTTTLAPVLVTGRSPPDASVAGWGDTPLSKAPLQASTIDGAQIREAGARRLSDLARFDPSVSEAYDTEGYIDYFTVRGFVIDNRFNFRRDGLPINAETTIPLDNKARVDVLKGLSGMQAGTSAPGGLIDLIVKRPLDVPLSSAFVEWRQRGSVLGSIDLSRRFGIDDAFGLRLNAAAEHIDPLVRDARGSRMLLALAGDWRLGRGTLIEAEVERSHRSQPSVPGFSLLGNRVPPVPDPRLSLNDQPWSLPGVFDATTASLRVTHQIGSDWRFVAHGATQRLRTDDRVAFPFGCTAADGSYYPDRYCPDGTFDLYDYRSEDERRRSDVLDLSLRGKVTTGPIGHSLVVGALRNVVHNVFPSQAFNFAGTGNVDGTAITPPVPQPSGPVPGFDQRSTEFYVRDAVAMGERATLWLGARHSRIERQSFTTPFAAASYAVLPGQSVYASWGGGVELGVAPDLPRYVNQNQPVAPAKSRQIELGFKGGAERLEWSVAVFDVKRPLFGDIGACDVDASCERALVGTQRHRGFEGQAAWRDAGWDLRGGVQWLHARVEGVQDPLLDGRRPTNVPALTVRLQASYAVATVPGFAVQGGASYESRRDVLPDNSLEIPSVTRFDLGSRLQRKFGDGEWTLRAGIDNLFDRRAWRESPYQFGHAYLFPLAPRTIRVSLQVDL